MALRYVIPLIENFEQVSFSSFTSEKHLSFYGRDGLLVKSKNESEQYRRQSLRWQQQPDGEFRKTQAASIKPTTLGAFGSDLLHTWADTNRLTGAVSAF